MGYDITYHPISPEEMRRWYFEPIKDDGAIDRLAVSEGVDVEKLQEAFDHYRKFLSEAPLGDSFEKTHGYLLAAAQGLFRPYFYNRGCLLTSLLEGYQRNIFLKYFTSLRDLVPDEYRSLEFSGGIEENWCGGAYLSADGVERLEYDIYHDANVALRLLQEFAPDGLRVLLKALRYAKKNGLGLLEATEVLSPFLDSAASDVDHAEFGYGDDEEGDEEIREIFTSLGHVDVLNQYPRHKASRPKTLEDEIADKLLSTALRQRERLADPPLVRLKKTVRFWNRVATVLFLLILLPIVCMAIWGTNEYLLERRLPLEGVPGEVTVTKHYTVGSQKNPKINYMLNVDGKEYTRHEVGVSKGLWNTIGVGSKLPVVYLPTIPRLSRLTSDTTGERMALGLMTLGLFGMAFFGPMFLASALGFDIQTNTKKASHIGRERLPFAGDSCDRMRDRNSLFFNMLPAIRLVKATQEQHVLSRAFLPIHTCPLQS